MKVQKKVLFLAIFFILSVSMYACKEGNPSLSQEDQEMVNPEKEDKGTFAHSLRGKRPKSWGINFPMI